MSNRNADEIKEDLGTKARGVYRIQRMTLPLLGASDMTISRALIIAIYL